jgi:hypothetical protein
LLTRYCTIAYIQGEMAKQNQEKLAKDTIIAYEDDPDDYELMPPAPQIDPLTGQPIQTQPGMEVGAPTPGAEKATAGGGSSLPPLPPI